MNYDRQLNPSFQGIRSNIQKMMNASSHDNAIDISSCHRGSTRYEQNYSSVIDHIRKDFRGELDTLLKDLLDRLMNLSTKSNSIIAKQSM